jgi:hypothetical protein
MTTIINLFNGPSGGKSTAARLTAAQFSIAHKRVEYVSEYVKGWAWEKRPIGPFDQLYFFGQQAKKEYALLGNVDWIITDSPVALCLIYARKYSPRKLSAGLEQMCRGYYDTVHDMGHSLLNIRLVRDDTLPYDQDGRFEDLTEALEVDAQVKLLLDWMQFDYIELPMDANAVCAYLQERCK